MRWEQTPRSVMELCVREHSVAQSCLTPCDPRDCSPPGSSVHGILQARILGAEINQSISVYIYIYNLMVCL